MSPERRAVGCTVSLFAAVALVVSLYCLWSVVRPHMPDWVATSVAWGFVAYLSLTVMGAVLPSVNSD